MPLDVVPALLRAQSHFLAESVDEGRFAAMVQDLLALTASAYGGLAEFNPSTGSAQFFSVLTSQGQTNPYAWWPIQPEHRSALKKGRAVLLSAEPQCDVLAELLGVETSGVHYCILPLQSDGELVGIALLASPDKPYSTTLLKILQPLLVTFAQLIIFQRQVKQRLHSQEKHQRQQASLRALSQITALRQQDDHHLIADALYLGCNYFGVPFGIVSHIEQDDYLIEVQYSANQALHDGALYRLGHTYCSITYQADDIVAISMMGLSPWANHPCYAEMGLETYIGIPIWVAGHRYGTLNFSSPDVQERPFDDVDYEFLRLMARWVGGTIERQLARQERDEIAERFRKIGAQVPGLIFQTRMNQDGSSAYLYASAGIEDIYGLKPADVADDATKVLAYLHADDVNDVVASYTKALESLVNWDTVYRVNHPQKGLIWVEAHAKPERTPEGDTLWYGMVMDVTEQQAAKSKLQQAMQAAEAANQAKSLFLANMSHEIRTPMNGVLGMISLLLDSNLTPQQREYAETVRFSGDVLMGVINDILDFSKIEAGRLELEEIDFDLPRLLNDFSAMMSLRLQEKGLRYQCEIASSVPAMLRGDPGRLRQVLINLVGNAIKFTEHGHVRVNVSVQQYTADVITLRFCVSDTGIGIPADKIHRLFNSFSQVDESTSRRFGGTGLGLAICKQIVTLMNGDIAAHSVAEQGTDFVFTVQMALASAVVHQRVRMASTPLQQRVLLVDAIETHREALASLLDAWAGEVVSVASAEQALAMLREAAASSSPFTLAIFDLHLPDMDGLQLARRVKADRALAALSLMLVTAIGVRGDGSRAHQAGFAAYLTKPVLSDEFYGVLELVLQGQGESQLVTRHTLKETHSAPQYKVLLVEDNQVNRMVAVKMLEKLGCTVVTAENGRFALMSVMEQPFDLVFMDMQMPEMDGLEATRLIRSQANGSLSKIPIIALTANALADDKQRCFDAGMDDFLVKPIQADALQKALQQWGTRP